ncbi:MAG: YraN family protein [Paenibacillaceae bacterium]|jgi:putative endonuclease|nr:YraN family protein [Paenibacillaceae bacterium]
MKPDTRKQLGKFGEEMAVQHLQTVGHRILERNWRCASGEIDIISEHEDTLIFTEVRTRRPTGTFGTAAESIHARKQRKVREIAAVYVHRHYSHMPRIRFDAIAIQLKEDGTFHSPQHYVSAF